MNGLRKTAFDLVAYSTSTSLRHMIVRHKAKSVFYSQGNLADGLHRATAAAITLTRPSKTARMKAEYARLLQPGKGLIKLTALQALIGVSKVAKHSWHAL
jgi:hypothetical protein